MLVVALALYQNVSGDWLRFLILILAPDLAILGYLAGPHIGAPVYNLAHFEAFPAALGLFGFLMGNTLALALALIWFAHIGGDRLLGFGLKYPTAFKDTHLNRV